MITHSGPWSERTYFLTNRLMWRLRDEHYRNPLHTFSIADSMIRHLQKHPTKPGLWITVSRGSRVYFDRQYIFGK